MTRGIILIILLLSGFFIFIFTYRKQEAVPVRTVIGLKAPELNLKDAYGNRYNLSNLKGSVVFINFWASWCEACKEEMPSIQALLDRFKDDAQFRMLTILYKDDYQKAIDYIKKNNFRLPVLIDDEGKTARYYGVTGVPETYIVDKKGILRKRIIGPVDWSSPSAISLVSNLINE